MKRLVVGVLAHVDSGKTTLSEALLYRAGSIRKLGRVDHRDAFLDTDALEKARGITIFAKQAVLTLPAGTVTGIPLEETQITLLDTPGSSAGTVGVKSTQPSPKRPRSSRRRMALSAPGRSILLT